MFFFFVISQQPLHYSVPSCDTQGDTKEIFQLGPHGIELNRSDTFISSTKTNYIALYLRTYP